MWGNGARAFTGWFGLVTSEWALDLDWEGDVVLIGGRGDVVCNGICVLSGGEPRVVCWGGDGGGDGKK